MLRTALIAVLLLAVVAPAGAAGKGLDTEVSLNFVETPLSDALTFIAQVTKVHIVIDPASKADAKKLTANLKEVTARSALSIITSTVGVAWDERWGGVFVSTKKRLEKLPKARLPLPAAGEQATEDAALRRRLSRLTITFNFARTPVPDCLEFIRSFLNINLVLDESVRAEAERMLFDGTVVDAAAGDVLALILVPRGLTAEIRSGVVFVRMAGPAKPPAKRAVKKDVPEVLESTRLQVNFLDTDLATVAGFLRRKVKYPIHVDPQILAERSKKDRLVTIESLKPLTARQALDLVAMQTRLDWDVRWGGVFLATKERLAALPKDLLPAEKKGESTAWEVALRKQLAEERVTYGVRGGNLLEALGSLREKGRINILVTPKAAKAAAKLPVDFQVDKRPLREVLTLLLVPRGFTFDLAHEVVVVRLGGV